jgi:hypothetical protein
LRFFEHGIIAEVNQACAGRSTHLPVVEFFPGSLPSYLHSLAAGLIPSAGFSGTTSPMSKSFFTLPWV